MASFVAVIAHSCRLAAERRGAGPGRRSAEAILLSESIPAERAREPYLDDADEYLMKIMELVRAK